MTLIPGLGLDPRVRSQLLATFLHHRCEQLRRWKLDCGARAELTAGYRFNQSGQRSQQYAFRFDFQPDPNHHFEFIHQRFKETDDALISTLFIRPLVFTASDAKFFVGAWRWTISPKLNNEFRAGEESGAGRFQSRARASGASSTAFRWVWRCAKRTSSHRAGIHGRTSTLTTRLMSQEITRCSLEGSLQNIRVNPTTFAGRFPTIGFGFSLLPRPNFS